MLSGFCKNRCGISVRSSGEIKCLLCLLRSHRVSCSGGIVPPAKKKSCQAVAAVAKTAVSGRIGRRSGGGVRADRCKSVSVCVQSVRIGAGIILQVSCSVLRSAGESPRWSGSGGAFFFSRAAFLLLRPCFVLASSAAGLVVVLGFVLASCIVGDGRACPGQYCRSACYTDIG